MQHVSIATEGPATWHILPSIIDIAGMCGLSLMSILKNGGREREGEGELLLFQLLVQESPPLLPYRVDQRGMGFSAHCFNWVACY